MGWMDPARAGRRRPCDRIGWLFPLVLHERAATRTFGRHANPGANPGGRGPNTPGVMSTGGDDRNSWPRCPPVLTSQNPVRWRGILGELAGGTWTASLS